MSVYLKLSNSGKVQEIRTILSETVTNSFFAGGGGGVPPARPLIWINRHDKKALEWGGCGDPSLPIAQMASLQTHGVGRWIVTPHISLSVLFYHGFWEIRTKISPSGQDWTASALFRDGLSKELAVFCEDSANSEISKPGNHHGYMSSWASGYLLNIPKQC